MDRSRTVHLDQIICELLIMLQLVLLVTVMLLAQTVHGKPLESEDKFILDDIFISVKSTGRYHESRLRPVLDTWASLAPSSTWVITDTEAEWAARRLGPRLVVTSCPPDHSRQALCCKMEAELTTFLRDTQRGWFCHVDDDNYLNVPALTKTLSAYNPEQDWYLGKVSISKPLQIYDKVQKREVEFYFGTGGAGFCLSRSVAEKIGDLSWSLSEIGDRIGLPDDVTVGYLATVVLGVPLTPLPGLHSHLEALRRLGEDGGDLRDAITLSYGVHEDGARNHVSIPGLSLARDPTTLYSLHCLLFGKCSDESVRRKKP